MRNLDNSLYFLMFQNTHSVSACPTKDHVRMTRRLRGRHIQALRASWRTGRLYSIVYLHANRHVP